MESTTISGWSRLSQVLRAFVRQLAAAVYVIIALAFLTKWTGGYIWIEPALTFLGGLILSAIIAGPWWSTHLVGLFVGLIQVGLSLSMGQEASWKTLILWTVLATVFGALGARIPALRRSRKAA